ncbi:hypothetical protein RFI_16134, partial [Reticulomyxa filosa]
LSSLKLNETDVKRMPNNEPIIREDVETDNMKDYSPNRPNNTSNGNVNGNDMNTNINVNVIANDKMTMMTTTTTATTMTMTTIHMVGPIATEKVDHSIATKHPSGVSPSPRLHLESNEPTNVHANGNAGFLSPKTIKSPLSVERTSSLHQLQHSNSNPPPLVSAEPRKPSALWPAPKKKWFEEQKTQWIQTVIECASRFDVSLPEDIAEAIVLDSIIVPGCYSFSGVLFPPQRTETDLFVDYCQFDTGYKEVNNKVSNGIHYKRKKPKPQPRKPENNTSSLWLDEDGSICGFRCVWVQAPRRQMVLDQKYAVSTVCMQNFFFFII